MSYCVIDLETSIKNQGEGSVGNSKGSPWHPENKVVVFGFKNKSELCIHFLEKTFSSSVSVVLDSNVVVVGHNIKFDLLWLRRINSKAVEKWLPKAQVWDTQLAEYLLTGMDSKFASLDELSEKYGGTKKDERIKSFWDAGIDTADIPPELLEEYTKNDVLNTEIVFLKQLEKAKEKEMYPLIQTQMKALLATFEMEWNGMAFSKGKAEKFIASITEELSHIENSLYLQMREHFLPMYECSVSSNQDISRVLFGGEYVYVVDEPMKDMFGEPVCYKSGKKVGSIKTKRVAKIGKSKGMGFKPMPEWETKQKGIYQTGEEILKQFKGHVFINKLLEFRALSKDLNTYFIGYSEMVWPDGKIHSNIHHAATDTGRLSSSGPNIQNLTRAEEE